MVLDWLGKSIEKWGNLGKNSGKPPCKVVHYGLAREIDGKMGRFREKLGGTSMYGGPCARRSQALKRDMHAMSLKHSHRAIPFHLTLFRF